MGLKLTWVKNSVKAKYGVSSSTLDLNNSVHRQMSAKLIWQHYRQALDKEYNVSQTLWTIVYRPFCISAVDACWRKPTANERAGL